MDDDLSVWKLVLGGTLSADDRAVLTEVDCAIFRSDPDFLIKNVAQTRKVLPRLLKQDPVEMANLRVLNTVTPFCKPSAIHLSPDEAKRLQAVISEHIPILGFNPSTNCVLTPADVDGWAGATKFVADKAGVSLNLEEVRSSLLKICKEPKSLGPKVAEYATNMERNWKALQLVWPHLGQADRDAALSDKIAYLKKVQSSGKGSVSAAAAVSALLVGQLEYENYPYALDPTLFAYKKRMDARMARFQRNIEIYSLRNAMRTMHNIPRQIAGLSEDPSDAYNPIPLPIP